MFSALATVFASSSFATHAVLYFASTWTWTG